MFLVMILAFLIGAICMICAVKEYLKKDKSINSIIFAVIGILFIGFAIYLALPHYS